METDDDLEVVWSGSMPLLPDRDQRPHFTYEAPKRKYTKQDPAVDGKAPEGDDDDYPEY